MSAGTYNITIEQGARWTRVLTVETDGEAWNLTGYSARMQIRKKVGGDLYVELTVGDGITLGGAEGTITLTIGATDTAALDFSSGRYDLELIPASGEDDAIRLLQGTVTLSKEVTV